MDRTELYNSSGWRGLLASYEEDKLMHDTNMTCEINATLFRFMRGNSKHNSKFQNSKRYLHINYPNQYNDKVSL